MRKRSRQPKSVVQVDKGTKCRRNSKVKTQQKIVWQTAYKLALLEQTFQHSREKNVDRVRVALKRGTPPQPRSHLLSCHALPPGDLADPGIEPVSPALAGRFFTNRCQIMAVMIWTICYSKEEFPRSKNSGSEKIR